DSPRSGGAGVVPAAAGLGALRGVAGRRRARRPHLRGGPLLPAAGTRAGRQRPRAPRRAPRQPGGHPHRPRAAALRPPPPLPAVRGGRVAADPGWRGAGAATGPAPRPAARTAAGRTATAATAAPTAAGRTATAAPTARRSAAAATARRPAPAAARRAPAAHPPTRGAVGLRDWTPRPPSPSTSTARPRPRRRRPRGTRSAPTEARGGRAARLDAVPDQPVYLDHAATTPLRPAARAAMLPWLGERFGNPSGAHRVARAARQAIDEARDVVAEVVGCRPGDVVFTSGGTEADNLAVLGAHEARPGPVLCSAVEHEAVLRPVHAVGGRTVPVDRHGVVDLDAL